MRTTIAADELNTEIQELYLENKQRLSDLEFLKMELGFIIKRLKSKLSSSARFNHSKQVAALLTESAETGAAQLSIKSGTAKYLNRLESLMNDSNQRFGIDLIEINSSLERTYREYLIGFKSFKIRSFDLTKNLLKEEEQAPGLVKTSNGFKVGQPRKRYNQFRRFYDSP